MAFVTTQELEDRYPDLTPKEREDRIRQGAPHRIHPAVSAAQLRSGKPHDGRAPDYDDWDLNGDLLFWDEPLGQCAGGQQHGHPGQTLNPWTASSPWRAAMTAGSCPSIRCC